MKAEGHVTELDSGRPLGAVRFLEFMNFPEDELFQICKISKRPYCFSFANL